MLRAIYEVFFYFQHFLPLPGFIFMATDIKEHFNITISSPPSELFSIPRMIVFLLGNILSQYVCARSIFQLSSHYSSLTITMLLTLRKFVSIIISVSFLGNIFTAWHWIGTVLVFAGTSIFSYDIQRVCIKKIQWIIFFLIFVILTSPNSLFSLHVWT